MLLRGARQSRGEEAASSGSSLVVQGQDRLFAGTAYTCQNDRWHTFRKGSVFKSQHNYTATLDETAHIHGTIATSHKR